jgi:hypothetical protein
MASFEVREVLRLSTRPEVVFAGRIIDGVIRPGMEIQLELQKGLFCSCIVSGVEYIDRVSVGESLVGLRCAEQAPEEAAVYSDICPPGTVVQVLEPADARSRDAQQ